MTNLVSEGTLCKTEPSLSLRGVQFNGMQANWRSASSRKGRRSIVNASDRIPCSYRAVIGNAAARPLVPGQRAANQPRPSGSTMLANTIGMFLVSSTSAATAGVVMPTIRFGLEFRRVLVQLARGHFGLQWADDPGS